MFKNTAGQKFFVFAFDMTTNAPKAGDAANISAYIVKDGGAPAQLTDTSATEVDATNFRGFYSFDGTQTETNADEILLSGKSSTANIVVLGAPYAISTKLAGALLDAAYDFAKGTAVMPESYAANGVAPTPIQALYAIHQMLMQFAITDINLAVKNIANDAIAFNVTLDDADKPTAAARN